MMLGHEIVAAKLQELVQLIRDPMHVRIPEANSLQHQIQELNPDVAVTDVLAFVFEDPNPFFVW